MRPWKEEIRGVHLEIIALKSIILHVCLFLNFRICAAILLVLGCCANIW